MLYPARKSLKGDHVPRFQTHYSFDIRNLNAYVKLDAAIGEVGPAEKQPPKPKPRREVHAPAERDTHSGEDRVEIFKSLLKPLPAGRLVDLGAGHGKFSIAASELGWSVTAVDARTTRMPVTSETGIEWIESDVRDYNPSRFDCICVLGLFYHLTLPDQMELLRKCAGTLSIVDTHVSGRANVNVSGYEGTYFDEVPGASSEERDATPTASWKNEVSFWPTQESLIRMARDSGFSHVSAVVPSHAENRTFYTLYP